MGTGTVEIEWRSALSDGRFEEAHKLYLLGDAPDPEVRRALAGLVDVVEFVREKSWTRALRKLERLEELPSVIDPSLLDWAALRDEIASLSDSSSNLDQVRPDEALQILESRDHRWFPAEAANQRGTARVFSGDIPAAQQDFREAVEKDPRHYRALTNLGNAALEAGEVEKAIGYYERALSVNEDFANAHHNLGVAYRRQGKVGRSVRQLRRAQRVQHRSEQERVREGLGEGTGKTGLKALRWVLYALVAAAVLILLRGQGFL